MLETFALVYLLGLLPSGALMAFLNARSAPAQRYTLGVVLATAAWPATALIMTYWVLTGLFRPPTRPLSRPGDN